MPDVLIKEAEFKQLDALVSKIPTGYGFDIAYLLRVIQQRRAVEAKQEEEKRKEHDLLENLGGLKEESASQTATGINEKIKNPE